MIVAAPRRRRADGIPTTVIPVAVTEPLRIPAHWASSAWAPAVAGVATVALILLLALIVVSIAAVLS